MKRIMIFTILVISLGWIGWGADLLFNNDFSQGLGLLFFILAPLLLALVFTIKDKRLKILGLKPKFRINANWYVFCIFFDLAVFIFVFIVGIIGNGMETALNLKLIGVILSTALLSIPMSFIKNIFEEVGWRGYLSERLYYLMNPIPANIIVGLIWATWQLPYWLIIIPRDMLIADSPYSNIWLIILMGYLALINLSFLYNRLKLVTRSVWPVVLIHTMNNVIVASLFINIVYTAQTKWFFSPGINGILYFSVLLLVNIYLEVKHPIGMAGHFRNKNKKITESD